MKISRTSGKSWLAYTKLDKMWSTVRTEKLVMTGPALVEPWTFQSTPDAGLETPGPQPYSTKPDYNNNSPIVQYTYIL